MSRVFRNHMQIINASSKCQVEMSTVKILKLYRNAKGKYFRSTGVHTIELN